MKQRERARKGEGKKRTAAAAVWLLPEIFWQHRRRRRWWWWWWSIEQQWTIVDVNAFSFLRLRLLLFRGWTLLLFNELEQISWFREDDEEKEKRCRHPHFQRWNLSWKHREETFNYAAEKRRRKTHLFLSRRRRRNLFYYQWGMWSGWATSNIQGLPRWCVVSLAVLSPSACPIFGNNRSFNENEEREARQWRRHWSMFDEIWIGDKTKNKNRINQIFMEQLFLSLKNSSGTFSMFYLTRRTNNHWSLLLIALNPSPFSPVARARANRDSGEISKIININIQRFTFSLCQSFSVSAKENLSRISGVCSSSFELNLIFGLRMTSDSDEQFQSLNSLRLLLFFCFFLDIK